MRATAVAVLAVAALTGCDRGARKDLPQKNQQLDQSDAVVVVMPDGFPNISHKCVESTGFWTTTDRLTVIVYNDPQCPGAEGTPFIISNVPGARGSGASE